MGWCLASTRAKPAAEAVCCSRKEKIRADPATSSAADKLWVSQRNCALARSAQLAVQLTMPKAKRHKLHSYFRGLHTPYLFRCTHLQECFEKQ